MFTFLRNRCSSSPEYAVTAPLGFFVLALLIVEGFLGTVLVAADLENVAKVIGMWMGVGMFVLVMLAVFLLVWFKPQSLTFDKDAHLIDKGKAPYGTDSYQVKNRDELRPTEANNNE